MLEAAQYEQNAFLTVTYSDADVPEMGTLRPVDLQLFIKRLRKFKSPETFRYYAVGEYGDLSNRPHYHLAMFNFTSCLYGRTRDRTVMLGRSCCRICDDLQNLWGKGHVFAGTLEADSASYIAGYVTKKLTDKNDPRLEGRYPEFARMSLKPGIGHSALHEVASQLMRYNLDETEIDVPMALRHGKRQLPLGNYLRRNLRKMVGKDEKAPQKVLDNLAAEMHPLRLAARQDAENPSLKSQIIKKSKGSIARLETLSKIYKQRKNL